MMKKLNLFVSLITICFLLTGCLRSNSTGVMKGFVEFSGRVSIGITSDICDFNADDVKLTIHYGVSETMVEDMRNNIVSYGGFDVPIALVIYVYDKSLFDLKTFSFPMTDYKQVENVHILKEVTKEELLTGKYTYKTKSTFGEWAEVIFSVKEEMVIPREVFSNENGNFEFFATVVLYSEKQKEYYAGPISAEYLHYSYTDENNLKLGQ